MAISPITTSVARGVFHTALAGVATKGVGSGYRVWDDRNAPWSVKKNTLQRESVTLGMVSVFTGLIDWVGHQFNLTKIPLKALQSWMEKAARHQILLKSIPIALGIFAAEAISRKIAPRDLWKPGGELNERVIEGQDERDDEDDDDAVTEKKMSPEILEKKMRASEHPIKHQPLTFAQATSPTPPALPSPTLWSDPGMSGPLVNPFVNPFPRAGLAPAFRV